MKKLFPAALAAILIFVLAACSPEGIAGREDILDKTVGVLSGSVTAAVAARLDPDMELAAFDSPASLKDAVKKGRVDCAERGTRLFGAGATAGRWHFGNR